MRLPSAFRQERMGFGVSTRSLDSYETVKMERQP